MQNVATSDVTKVWVALLHLPCSPSGSYRIPPPPTPSSTTNPHSPRSFVSTSPSSKTMLNVVSRNIAHPILAGHPVARSLASRAGLISTTRALSTTPVVHNSSQGPFSFLPANKLEKKIGRGERSKGLTEIRGSYYNPVTYTYLNELSSDWGEFVDGVKVVFKR